MRNGLTPERDALAAELALGVLEGEERAEAQRLCLADPAFATAVENWRLQLGVLHETIADEPLPSGLWSAIDARLNAADNTETVSKLRFWRRSAWASGAVAAALAVVLLLPRAPAVRTVVLPPAQSAIAQLNGEAGAILAASYTPQAGQLQIRPVDLPDSKLSPELWLIPADGVPRSLGLIGTTGTTRIDVPLALRAYLTDGAVLAVSLERAETAPHKAPTSTPIAVGKISTI
jgi:anti-sigma-K factor RskA